MSGGDDLRPLTTYRWSVEKGGGDGMVKISAMEPELKSPRDVLKGPNWMDNLGDMATDWASSGSSSSPMLSDMDVFNWDCPSELELQMEEGGRQAAAVAGAAAAGEGGGVTESGGDVTGGQHRQRVSELLLGQIGSLPACSVNLKDIRVSNEGVLQRVVDGVGVEEFLRFVVLWHRGRQHRMPVSSLPLGQQAMYQPWSQPQPQQQQQQQDGSLYQYGYGDSRYTHGLYETCQLPEPLSYSSRSNSVSPPGLSPRMSHSGSLNMLPPQPLNAVGAGLVSPLQGEDGLVSVVDNKLQMSPEATQASPAAAGVSGRRTRQQNQLQNLMQLRAHTPAATTRAARRHRMARQRQSLSSMHHHHHHHHHPRGGSSGSVGATHVPCANFSLASAADKSVRGGGGASQRSSARQPAPSSQPPDLDGASLPSRHGRSMADLQFLFRKELKPSDVGSLGRIILPKREAESQLPQLNVKDGIPIHAEDFHTGKLWTLKYRYWPNNKSRMYVLESTGEFVKLNRLEEGDWMVLYRCTSSARPKYVLRGKKRRSSLDAIDFSEMSGRLVEESVVSEGNGDGSTASTSATATNEEDAGMVGNTEAAGAQEPAPALALALAVDTCDLKDGCDNEFLQGFVDDSNFDWDKLDKFLPLERYQPFETDMCIDGILDDLPVLHHPSS